MRLYKFENSICVDNIVGGTDVSIGLLEHVLTNYSGRRVVIRWEKKNTWLNVNVAACSLNIVRYFNKRSEV